MFKEVNTYYRHIDEVANSVILNSSYSPNIMHFERKIYKIKFSFNYASMVFFENKLRPFSYKRRAKLLKIDQVLINVDLVLN